MLHGIDKAWKVETNFFLSQVGQSGEERFQSLILEALPSPEMSRLPWMTAHAKLKALASTVTSSSSCVSVCRSKLESITIMVEYDDEGAVPQVPGD